MGSGVWQTPVDLSLAGGDATTPQLALDPQGNAVAVWSRSNGANLVVQGAVRAAAGGTWQAPVDISVAGEDAASPHIGVDPLGNAIAVWERFDGTNFIVQGAVRPAGSGIWQPPVNLSVAGKDARRARVALDPQGNAVAVWTRSNGANTISQSSVRTAATGAWQEPVDLSVAGGDAGESRVSVDPHGNAIAVWRRYNGTIDVVQGAVRSAGSGAWQAPVDLSATGSSAFGPEVALDPTGSAAAVWYAGRGADTIIQGTGYDTIGPLLGALSIPTAGTAGQPLSFSVSPFDVWSPLGITSWSFGDGAGANGPNVTHAYAAAGRYGVTLASADALGNTTSTSATIAIAKAPPLTPPLTLSASLTNKRFRVARKGTAISARKVPQGTTFRFTLSAAATLQIAITHSARGLRRGRRCLAPTAKLMHKHAKRCTARSPRAR
ncbi:MAG: PKD domain-containing protein [Solirubrobacterales bacterium]|nr:PKD domain-containing protein [Solirubrobacterales bacterium]